MAKEYIEREAVIRKIKCFAADVIFRGCKVIMTEEESCNPVEWTKGYEQGVKDTANLIAGQAAADMVEVRHGRWLKTEEPLGWHEVDCIECSACHDSWIADEDYGLDFADFWKYCPTCGARMDGDG